MGGGGGGGHKQTVPLGQQGGGGVQQRTFGEGEVHRWFVCQHVGLKGDGPLASTNWCSSTVASMVWSKYTPKTK